MAADVAYGETGYEDDLAEVLDDLIFTQEEFDAILAALGITDLTQELENYEHCKDDKGDCESYYETLEDLLALEDTIWQSGIDSETGLESDGETPVIVEGAATESGVTVGPNFQIGRRTWVDVISD